MGSLNQDYGMLTDLEIVGDRSKTLKIHVKRRNENGDFAYLNTTGFSFYFTVKRAYDSTAVIALMSDATNLLHYNDSTGLIYVYLKPAHTADLIERREYYWDLIAKDASSQYWPVLRGRLKILWGVKDIT